MPLSLTDVDIRIKNRVLFKRFNIEVENGSIAALMGPSGSGKSTLFNFILGDLFDDDFTASGQVFLNGKNLDGVPIQKRQIGILFQDPLLFPHLSVAENLAFGMKERLPIIEKKRIISQALEKARLQGLEDQDPETLSGGEKTRVSLLRTLLSKPQAILLDEPFSKLDKTLRNQFRDHVFTMLREQDIPVLLVTHDPDDIPASCEQLIQLEYA